MTKPRVSLSMIKPHVRVSVYIKASCVSKAMCIPTRISGVRTRDECMTGEVVRRSANAPSSLISPSHLVKPRCLEIDAKRGTRVHQGTT